MSSSLQFFYFIFGCILHLLRDYDRVHIYPPKRNFGQPEVRALALKKVQNELHGKSWNYSFISDKRYNYTDMGGVIR